LSDHPKVDLVMWTKNGEKTLGTVLDRLNKVIPPDFINQKFIIDDNSADHTRKIAQEKGWDVYFNDGSGISDGANTALNNVEVDFFCSFEQDVILAKEWWDKVAIPFFNSDLAASSGMRFNSQPKGMTVLFKYVAKKYRGEQLSPWLKSREANAFTLGKTLDNTIYRTETISKIGGFPMMKVNAGVDTVLAWKLEKFGYKWKVDYNVQSIHLRKGLFDELYRQRWYGTQIKDIWRAMNNIGQDSPVNTLSVLYRLFLAPFSGLFVAFKTKEATVAYIHPLIRFYYAWGLLRGPSELLVCDGCGTKVAKLKYDFGLKQHLCSDCFTSSFYHWSQFLGDKQNEAKK
jgi:glycosyltransferase involved in cell wall biosynthesis